MWECMTGIEEVRSVPLEERIVTSMGEKELVLLDKTLFVQVPSVNSSDSHISNFIPSILGI